MKDKFKPEEPALLQYSSTKSNTDIDDLVVEIIAEAIRNMRRKKPRKH